jgi:hypothetical protein
MKLLCLNVVVLVLLTLTSVTSVAQMIPMTNTMRTPYGNVTTTNWVAGPRMSYGNGSGELQESGKLKFEITFSSDSVVTLNTSIHYADTSYFEWKDGAKQSHKVFPSQTVAIRRTTPKGNVIEGIPADSCWLFLVEKGAINSYSYHPFSSSFAIIAIRSGDQGPIVPATKENIEPLLASDDEALEALKNKGPIAAISIYNKNQVKAAKKSAKRSKRK